ncbi:MAG: hypothetical protein HY305_06160, partial [Sphingobacteriales bacterium]|nr:hypothetical protein [Sphingobacteriales bacterium]
MKKSSFIIFLTVVCLTVRAQNYAGYSSGNYSGVNGVFFNPGNIADSRYRWSFNLVSANATIANNYGTIQAADLMNGGSEGFDKYITRKTGGQADVLADLDIFGPSLMVNLTAKSAISVTTRRRVMYNLDQMPVSLLTVLQDKTADVTFPARIDIKQFGLSANNWSEFGLTYA